VNVPLSTWDKVVLNVLRRERGWFCSICLLDDFSRLLFHTHTRVVSSVADSSCPLDTHRFISSPLKGKRKGKVPRSASLHAQLCVMVCFLSPFGLSGQWAYAKCYGRLTTHLQLDGKYSERVQLPAGVLSPTLGNICHTYYY